MCAFIGSTFCLTFDVDSSFEEFDSLSDMLAPGFASCAPMSSILSRMLDGPVKRHWGLLVWKELYLVWLRLHFVSICQVAREQRGLLAGKAA